MKDRWLYKRWHSLSQLKEAIELSGEEKVVSFVGHTLITNKYKYMLGSERLYVYELEDVPAPKKKKAASKKKKSTKKKAVKKKASKKKASKKKRAKKKQR